MTKIFCDIADVNLIKKFNKKKIVKGFTTNPSLIRKAGAKDYSKYTKQILKITNKPVSCEVFADDIKNMIIQGIKINSWGKNVFVKVPATNSKGYFTGKVIKFLNKKDKKDFDKAAEDLRLAIRHLGMIVGKVDVEEILGSIFNDFCIGK